MKSVFYAGASGLIAQQEYMNNVGNNIANINTYGYQPTSTSFEALLNNEMYVNTESDPIVGIGVKNVSTGINVGNGSLQNTQNLSDFAILDESFFAVETSNGEIQYTRNGAFTISMEGSNGYLATQDGAFVLDSSGNRIQLENIGDTSTFDLSTLTSTIGTYSFNYARALQPVANNRYAETATSGTATANADDSKNFIQGALEMSGVSMEEEMANLITAQRAYQLSARVVQVGDENEQTINTLRR